MRISAKVKTRASVDSVKYDKKTGKYLVCTTKSAIEGQANKALVAILADYLDIPKTSIVIKAGMTSRNKILEIPDK